MRELSTAIPLDAVNSIQAGSLRYTYRGIPMVKNPFDIALYIKLLFDLKPRTVIEIGTFCGGSAPPIAAEVRQSIVHRSTYLGP